MHFIFFDEGEAPKEPTNRDRFFAYLAVIAYGYVREQVYTPNHFK